METLFRWSKFVDEDRLDEWEIRLIAAEIAYTADKPVNRKRWQLSSYVLTRAEADVLRARYGGGVNEVYPQDWQPSSEEGVPFLLKVRDRLVITEAADGPVLAALVEQFRDRIVLSFPPQLAFGTGGHPTTAGCLRFLSDIAKERADSDWSLIDLGCGSGILAIAAAKLGASRIVAVEIDDVALKFAIQNAERHGVADRIEFVEGDAIPLLRGEGSATYDVIAANLFSSLLVELLPIFPDGLNKNGDFVISGFLTTQTREILEAAQKSGLQLDDYLRRGKWVAARGRRRRALKTGKTADRDSPASLYSKRDPLRMNTSALLNVIRMFFLLLASFIGVSVALGEAPENWWYAGWVGAIFGLGFASFIIVLDLMLQGISIRSFSHGTFGLLIGLLCAWLVTRIGFFKAGWVEQFELAGNIFNLCIFLGFGFIGVMLALRSKREEFSLLIPYVRFRQDALQDLPTLLDTNVIIDGRVFGICEAGFLGGVLVVPRFVLEELQKMADSNEELKKSRGKRGLDCLNRMQNDDALDVDIHNTSFDPALSSDAMLVELADELGARILTNDGNLGKVARLKGIVVLNLNELAMALRPIVSPGDELELELVKEGKDDHQAVGYLPDGTMIVVNHGKPHIGSRKPVVVAGAVQTSAGRLIFAELSR